MTGVLWGKMRLLIRKPLPLLITTIICIAFAYLTGLSTSSKIEVPVHSSLPTETLNDIVLKLNESDTYEFVLYNEDEVKNKVAEGKAEAGVLLEEGSYTLYQAGETQNFRLINQYVYQFYRKMLQEEVMKVVTNKEETEKVLLSLKENPAFTLSLNSYKNETDWVYDQSLQALFGFALFFSIFTIGYNVVEILREKQMGIWDRLILSPTTKTKMYLGNLLYSFFTGYFQIALIFIVFRFGTGVNFYGGFIKTLILIIPFVFSIVALSILLTSLVKTMGQFNALIPLISVSFAMIGGAYWPIEIVTSEPLLIISKFVPITYGMELLKGVTVSGLSITDLLYPVSILLLMGVVMMGIGIRLMERRHI
ncbi:ABC transporter permease [Cytobacillus sp. FJAT-54145]|uniref:ABC transporter permease n=1 Tax=Cytobacillus spartinae TaxID=3299023 RepID=A0ABW6KC80_9BACI